MTNDTGGGAGDGQQPSVAVECSELMVLMAHTMAMQSAVAGIPIFDGSNLPLKDFIQDVRNAASDIDASQLSSFLKKVLGRLRGAARNSTFGVSFTSV